MTDTTRPPSPAEAWAELERGNARFVAGEPQHPHQDVAHRQHLAAGQHPIAALFGCSDSRLSAEILFDAGLGDLFVVRNAGQVVGGSVLGSLEYAVAVLKVPLLLVLGHDACGAVNAAIDSSQPDAPALPPHIAQLIAPIAPAVQRVITTMGLARGERPDGAEVGREHLHETVAELLRRSELISAAVAAGTLGIVAANYRLAEGLVVPDVVIGLPSPHSPSIPH